MVRALRTSILGLAVSAGLSGAAHACSVCYGAADGNMIDGARAAIVFMLALTYLLVGGGLGMVWIARRRRSNEGEER